MPRIGAHVSAAAELPLSLERASNIGAQCIQIFISPPRQWNEILHPQHEIEEFKDKAKRLHIGPNFIHATYLINLASESPDHLQKSVHWLRYGMEMAKKLELQGVIVHTGSHKGKGFEAVKGQISNAIKEVLASSPDSQLILEVAAGAGGVIGNFQELGEILNQVEDDMLKICLDTQHTFALGYDLTNKEGITKTLDEFNKTIGLKNLVVIHANDSKTECGSQRDRHENIGDGFIGRNGFSELLNSKKLNNLPFILEVPGFNGEGPDRENVEILKSLCLQ